MKELWKHNVDTKVADLMAFKLFLRRLGRLFELSWVSLMGLGRTSQDFFSKLMVFARKLLFWIRIVTFSKQNSDFAAEGWHWHCETFVTNFQKSDDLQSKTITFGVLRSRDNTSWWWRSNDFWAYLTTNTSGSYKLHSHMKASTSLQTYKNFRD